MLFNIILIAINQQISLDCTDISKAGYLFVIRARIIPTTLALNTTLYLSEEREYMPWESALDNLDYFYLMFDRTEIYGSLQVGLYATS